jgi:hypothetical protein
MSLFTTTNKGAMAPDHENHGLEYFSKAGNVGPKSNPYANRESISTWFKMFYQDPMKAMKLLFWARDPRGGAGHRRIFKEIIEQMTKTPIGLDWLLPNISLIPEHGRWDDLYSLYGTNAELTALSMFRNNLDNELCAKWVKRKDSRLREYMSLEEGRVITNKEFRKILVSNSNTVEQLMSAGKYSEIDYTRVPALAGIRYLNAFLKHDKERFLNHVREHGLKAQVAFPHEVMRIHKAGIDAELQQVLFESLPNFVKEGERILPVVDVSGSMNMEASGSITCMDVSVSLGMYVSDKIQGHFKRKYLTFSANPKLENWDNLTVDKAIESVRSSDWGFNTNIERALESILDQAKMFNVQQAQMPTILLILSDMQFDESQGHIPTGTAQTVIEAALLRWREAGYRSPAIVFWNLAKNSGQPSGSATNVAYISGFSPAILEATLGCVERDDDGTVKKLDPNAVLEKSIEKYEVKVPKGYEKFNF